MAHPGGIDDWRRGCFCARWARWFRVTPQDVTTYAAVLAMIGAVAVLASYVPARRASQVEPLTALRQE